MIYQGNIRLKRQGIEPSTRAIHRELGFGSRREVVRFLRQVKWQDEGGMICPVCDVLYKPQYMGQATCLSYSCGKEFNRRRSLLP